jgi:hypothetical protein
MPDDDLLDFGTYSKAPIFRNLANINNFSMLIEVPRVYRWINTPTATLVLSRLYDEVSRALTAAEFHSLNRLKPVLTQRSVSVEFDDADYGFTLVFDEDGDLNLLRRGSSFARFYEWYRRFMPSLESLVSRVLQGILEEVTMGRPSGQSFSPVLRPVRAQYRFRFIAYDFVRPPSDVVVRNSEVMTRLVQSLPGASGHLEGVSASAFEEFGRMDVNLNRWSPHPMGYCREVYAVEAPGNRGYSSVWFEFSYIGESREDAAGERTAFDPSLFLSRVDVPIDQFLRQRAIEAFVQDFTEGFVFQTTPSSLP